MIDAVDKKILGLLQEDSTLSLNDISEAVNLTTTPCWKGLSASKRTASLRKESRC